MRRKSNEGGYLVTLRKESTVVTDVLQLSDEGKFVAECLSVVCSQVAKSKRLSMN
jgi:hypothetical protein